MPASMSAMREAVSRVNASLIAPISSPSQHASRSVFRLINTRYRSTYICSSCRMFSSHQQRRQQAAAQAPEQEPESNTLHDSSIGQNGNAPQGDDHSPAPSSQIYTPRTYRYASRFKQNLQQPAPTGFPSGPAMGSSSSDKDLDGLGLEPTRMSTNKKAFQSLLFPPPNPDLQSYRAAQKPPHIDQSAYVAMNLSPRVGKSLSVDQATPSNLAVKLKKLDMLIARNGVRRDLGKQRFHERPGLKRKRLKSQSWRRRFKAQFLKTVERVHKLRRQGW